MQAQASPRRRGRPRKTRINHQFPGLIVPITSKPRLRSGVLCEIYGCVACHANNGKRVVIVSEESDGHWYARSIDGPLVTINNKTGHLNENRSPGAIFAAKNLYRIGIYTERRDE